MPKFKIRDLMVALRPGLATPERPQAIDCLDVSCGDPSVVCDDDDGSGCGDTCGDDTCGGTCDDLTCDFGTCGCTQTCGCTGTCGPCTGGCTGTCGACTGCTGTCHFVTCNACSIRVSCRGNSPIFCQEPSNGCGVSCRFASCAGCSIRVSCAGNSPIFCQEPSNGCAGGSVVAGARPVGQMAPAELARLKSQLRQTMQQVKQREQALAAAAEQRAVVPQTIDQVEALEKKLSEALEELRQRRSELQKSAKEKK